MNKYNVVIENTKTFEQFNINGVEANNQKHAESIAIDKVHEDHEVSYEFLDIIVCVEMLPEEVGYNEDVLHIEDLKNGDKFWIGNKMYGVKQEWNGDVLIAVDTSGKDNEFIWGGLIVSKVEYKTNKNGKI